MSRIFSSEIKPIISGIFYPGEITLIGGAPSVGKTRFALHFLHSLANGTSGWWGSYPPMPVLYCSQRSIKVTEAQMRTVELTDIPDNMILFCPADLTKQEKSQFNSNPLYYVEKNVLDKLDEKPKIIIFDTLINYLPPTIGGKGINFNSYTDVVRGCDELYYWAQTHKLALAPLHHTAKQKNDIR